MQPASIRKLAVAAALVLIFCGSAALAQPDPATATVSPEPDGTVVLEGTRVPVSHLLSSEGAAYLRHLIVDKPFAGGPGPADIKGERAHQDRIMQGFLEPMRRRYAVTVEEQRIGGIEIGRAHV